MLEILNDPITTNKSSDKKASVDQDLVNIEDDDEELRRIQNRDNSSVPLTTTNVQSEIEKQNIKFEQIKKMQYLLKNKSSLSSNDEAMSYDDLWSPSLDKHHRQALYRYWLVKYTQLISGELMTNKEKEWNDIT